MSTSPAPATGHTRPSLAKTHSSQSSHGGSRNNVVTSPGSVGEHHQLRHAVSARQRHAKVVVPRNHNSARNLAKMGRQAQHAHQVAHQDDGRQHVRQRSHEGDTEIRLPGSLEADRPPIKRNMTAYDLPRAKSNAKLKKNLSHGQLTRLNPSGRNLAGISHKAPPSPGLKGKSKRPKSAETMPQEKDLHEQEVELYQMQTQTKAPLPKKVGFAVGSSGDTSEEGDMAQAEGSGQQDDEWTEESASASPYSTRQNTANNSRRSSVFVDKPPDKPVAVPKYAGPSLLPSETKQSLQRPERIARSEDEDEELSPRSQARFISPVTSHSKEATQDRPQEQHEGAPQDQPSPLPGLPPQQQSPPQHSLAQLAHPQQTPHQDSPDQHSPLQQSPLKQQQLPNPRVRSPLHAAKDHPNPTMKRFVSHQLPAPALVSSISALDNLHSNRGSPAPSIRSSRSNLGGDGAMDREQEDELVSRFIPSASHPGTGSGGNTGTMNTPKQGSFHTLEEESTMRRATFHPGPASPGSTISGSSGAATPALGRSRIELRMLQDKALADREAAVERERRPLVPNHHYDRRNETLKSYLNLAGINTASRNSITMAALSLGPEIFQGRFKAVNTELKVVQKFRDPISEAVERLRRCKGTKLSQQRSSPQKQQAAALKMSKSAVTLPARGMSKGNSKLSTSVSPPKNPAVEMAQSVSPQKLLLSSSSGKQIGRGPSNGSRHVRRGVSFAGTPPEAREVERSEDQRSPDTIARSMWDSMGV
ncbi:hypothetical protein LTR08_004644 [Meristemomyces frigidus]|nr:hypothetical protein LTR08_004644 [Meristemomyces frigidus]